MRFGDLCDRSIEFAWEIHVAGYVGLSIDGLQWPAWTKRAGDP